MGEPIHRFDAVPPLGTVLAIDAQPFELVALEPFRRKDGTSTQLLVWRGNCADCGEPFRCTTTVAVCALNRRCVLHKRPGRRVGGRRKQRASVVVRLAGD